MDRSKFSNIIATTRLLPHFSRNNITALKLCIFEQLGCENESQFLCKALNSLYKTMSVQSTATIKHKAIEIADSQQMIQTNNSTMIHYPTKHQKYNHEITKNMKSLLHENFW